MDRFVIALIAAGMIFAALAIGSGAVIYGSEYARATGQYVGAGGALRK